MYNIYIEEKKKQLQKKEEKERTKRSKLEKKHKCTINPL